jgi:hypothetical protein
MKIPHKVRLSNSRVATITFVIGMLVFAFVLEGQFIAGGILIPRSGVRFNEGPAPTGKIVKATGAAVLYADPNAHKLQLSNANGAYANVMTDAAASIPDSALTSNVALLNRASQTFTTNQIFDSGVNYTAVFGGNTQTSQSTVIQMKTGTNQKAWLVGANNNIAGTLEFTPSTANGGSTFSLPVASLTTAGAWTWTGAAATNTLHTLNGTTTGYHVTNWVNTTGNLLVGIETSAGGNVMPGTTAYAAVIDVVANKPLNIGTNNTLRFTFNNGDITNATGRIITSSATPTTSVAAGFCTSPSVAVDTGSGDDAGIITITTGTGCAAATGSVTVTFSTANGAYGTNTPSCVVTPFDGAAAWDTSVTWKTTAQSTTAFTTAFKNGGTNFTSSTTYKFNYHCWGK